MKLLINRSDPKAVKIELYSKQFDWTARYAGADNKFGLDDFTQIDGGNSMGLDTLDAKTVMMISL
jgi:cytochrome c oxidase subunit 2